ncbi:MAG: cell envelope biogenesis protein OmpA [Bacteroidota bacterium]
MPQNRGIDELKKILFEEENQKYQRLQEKLDDFQKNTDDKFKNFQLSEKEVEDLVSHITEVMPEKLGPAITKTLKTQIESSRDEVVQVLYPIMGQMIKKYIQKEIQILSERIDQQIQKTFSFESIIDAIKALFIKKSGGQIITEAYGSQIEEIFLIEKDSGLLIASYSKNELLDQDMVSGMLTAIKAFVEDAFQKEGQELETIEYDLYKIYLKSFNKFYVAAVVSGVFTATFQDKLDTMILKFVEEMTLRAANINKEDYEKGLEEYFRQIE